MSEKKSNHNLTIGIEADTTKLTKKLRAIAKHAEALAKELEAIDKEEWLCNCGSPDYRESRFCTYDDVLAFVERECSECGEVYSFKLSDK